MEQVFFFVGLILCFAVLAQLTLLLLGGARRLRYEGLRHEYALGLLREQIQQTRTLQEERDLIEASWRGFRKFRVADKVMETGEIASIYLEPHDGKPIASFEPGQFLTFRLMVPGRDKPVTRCYSLSDGPQAGHYRISTKKCAPPRDKPDAPPGLASSHFVDTIQPGELVDVAAPRGKFFLDTSSHAPVVLIGGGIGVTPVLAMLNSIVRSGSKRETWFFYGVRNSGEHIMKEHLQLIAHQHDNIHLHVCYSSPAATDERGKDYHHEGRVSVALLRELLPSSNYQYYLCGPPPMMASVVADLKEWRVPDATVHLEAFGPASVKKVSAATVVEATEEAAAATVTFTKSNKVLNWSSSAGSLLELAAANDIRIDSGCGAGDCDTCITAIKTGKVKYIKEPGSMPEGGSCLVCVSVPDGDLTLDA